MEITQLNPSQNKLLNYVLGGVGIIPYHDTYSAKNNIYEKNNYNIFLTTTKADSKGRVLKGLNEETFGAYVLYNEGFTQTYYKDMTTALNGATGITTITKDKLQPGDMAYNPDSGNVAFIVSINDDGTYKIVVCSDKKSAVVLEESNLSKYTTFYSLQQ